MWHYLFEKYFETFFLYCISNKQLHCPSFNGISFFFLLYTHIELPEDGLAYEICTMKDFTSV